MQRFTTSDGRTLSYAVNGEGPLVVMLPGGPGMDPSAYFTGADLIGFRQLIFCPRGTGASDAPGDAEGYRIDGYVSDVEELRRHLGAEQLMVYGNSHGAMTALAYALAHPGRGARMVLINGPARVDAEYVADAAAARQRFSDRAPEGAKRLQAAAEAEEALDAATDEVSRRAAYRAVMDRYVVDPTGVNEAFLDRLASAPMNFEAVGPMFDELLGGLDLLAGASRLSTPALVLAGELDATVPAEHVRRIADALPNGRYVELDGVGHFVEVEAYEKWHELVAGYLAEDPIRPP